MASLVKVEPDLPGTDTKKIPLMCCVCPETPRFSDVSHLLTHIASKGHLHHETQTKLRAHQDKTAHAALHQYEQWYKDHGIEPLLVERMRSKQVKEAARIRKSRAASVASNTKPRKKGKREPLPSIIKTEDDSYINPYGARLYMPSEIESEAPHEPPVSTDMLSLKGQIWPGMGKMDLANEEMKRTRNQRKPKSVIEKMRRTSEGIEPTQVVMTPKFEVDRIKGVYDESSPPDPDQEDSSPPQKVTKAKRKKSEPLSEISVNLVRRGVDRKGRAKVTQGRKGSKQYHEHSESRSPELFPSMNIVRNTRDMFREDGRVLASPSNKDPRFNLRQTLAAHAHSMYVLPRPEVASPSPASRELPHRFHQGRSDSRPRQQGDYFSMHGNHLSLASYDTTDGPFALESPALFDHDSVRSFSNTPVFPNFPHDQLRSFPNGPLVSKQEDQRHSMGDVPLSGAQNPHFMGLPSTNPLFSHQDRLLFSAYDYTPMEQTMPCLGFTPINNRDHEGKQGTMDSMEQQSYNGEHGDRKEPDFVSTTTSTLWNSHSPGEDRVRNGLDPVQLEI